MHNDTINQDAKGRNSDSRCDSTEQRALINKETLFRLLEEMPIGVYIADRTGKIIYGNRAGHQIWAGLRYVAPDQFSEYKAWWADSGKPISSDDWALNRAIKNGETSTGEEIIIECFDGTRKTIRNSALPLYDEEGKVCGGLATNEDITNQMAASAELKRLSNFPSQNPNPVLQMAHNGHVLYANAASANILKELGHSDERPLNETWTELVSKALQTEEPATTEMKIGDSFFSLSFAPIAEGRVNVYALDITERKYAELKTLFERDLLQTVMDGAKNSHLVFLDTDFNFIHVNEAYAKTCGYKPEDMIGKNHFTLYPDPDAEAIFARVRDTGEAFEIHDRPFEFPDQPERGTTYWDWTLTPAKDANGHIIGLVFSLFETTIRKRTEEALARTHKLESLGHLAAGIAHDFNNLLAGIYGYIELALIENLPREASQTLANASATIDRARSITQQLITFSKGGAPMLKPCDIEDIVQSATQLALSGSSVSARFTILPEVWQCLCDRSQIEQVIHNLVQNAIHAMPKSGDINIEIANTTISDEKGKNLAPGNYVRISVQDHGVGIPEDIRRQIFDPFFTTKELGRGLGLSTSFSIIDRHHGTIEVESKPHQGATFHVYIPSTDGSAPAEKDDKAIRGKQRLLLMDDEEIVLTTTSQMLTILGFQVTTARNGQEALDSFNTSMYSGTPFDLVILDLTIRGGWGGIRTVQEIRKVAPEIPVIVASGYANDPAMAQPSQFGFTDCIRKPFTMNELSAMLAKIAPGNRQ